MHRKEPRFWAGGEVLSTIFDKRTIAALKEQKTQHERKSQDKTQLVSFFFSCTKYSDFYIFWRNLLKYICSINTGLVILFLAGKGAFYFLFIQRSLSIFLPCFFLINAPNNNSWQPHKPFGIHRKIFDKCYRIKSSE